MTPVQIALLMVEGVAFAVWAVLMFRTLFLLRRRAEKRTGHTFSGPGPFLTEITRFVTDPEDRPARAALAFATAMMVGLILLSVLILGD